MFTRIEALRFRSLKFVDQQLGPFAALVGPNGSGKTTFLDVIALLGDLTRNRGDVVETLQGRSTTFDKLLWLGQGRSFQLAVEAQIPSSVRQSLAPDKREFNTIRYQIEIGFEPGTDEIGIDHETLYLMAKTNSAPVQRDLFPSPPKVAPEALSEPNVRKKMSLNKTAGGNDNYY